MARLPSSPPGRDDTASTSPTWPRGEARSLALAGHDRRVAPRRGGTRRVSIAPRRNRRRGPPRQSRRRRPGATRGLGYERRELRRSTIPRGDRERSQAVQDRGPRRGIRSRHRRSRLAHVDRRGVALSQLPDERGAALSGRLPTGRTGERSESVLARRAGGGSFVFYERENRNEAIAGCSRWP